MRTCSDVTTSSPERQGLHPHGAPLACNGLAWNFSEGKGGVEGNLGLGSKMWLGNQRMTQLSSSMPGGSPDSHSHLPGDFMLINVGKYNTVAWMYVCTVSMYICIYRLYSWEKLCGQIILPDSGFSLAALTRELWASCNLGPGIQSPYSIRPEISDIKFSSTYDVIFNCLWQIVHGNRILQGFKRWKRQSGRALPWFHFLFVLALLRPYGLAVRIVLTDLVDSPSPIKTTGIHNHFIDDPIPACLSNVIGFCH